MKGYKIFFSTESPNIGVCRDFYYKEGKTYCMFKIPKPCEVGFHFCSQVYDCFLYYPFYYFNRRYAELKIAEVESSWITKSSGLKNVTNRIKIIRFLTEDEIVSEIDLYSEKIARNQIIKENSWSFVEHSYIGIYPYHKETLKAYFVKLKENKCGN